MSVSRLGEVSTYKGMCEPSGAVPFPGPESFDAFVVASDEDNRLRIYAAGDHGTIPDPLNLELSPGKAGRQADLEGAAWLGGRMYWIGSHSRNSDRELRPERWRLFATTVAAPSPSGGTAGSPSLVMVAPARDLFQSLVVLLQSQKQIEDTPDNQPSQNGLNVEGLAASENGTSLRLGFRSPLLHGRSLVTELRNPAQVIDQGAVPYFAAELTTLDLGGRGIRSLEYVPARRMYLIVAGPTGDQPPRDAGDDAPDPGRFDLYTWSGTGSTVTRIPGAQRELATLDLPPAGDDARFLFHAEVAMVNAEGTRIRLLSDDGDRPMGGIRCQKLTNPADQQFRGVVLRWD